MSGAAVAPGVPFRLAPGRFLAVSLRVFGTNLLALLLVSTILHVPWIALLWRGMPASIDHWWQLAWTYAIAFMRSVLGMLVTAAIANGVAAQLGGTAQPGRLAAPMPAVLRAVGTTLTCSARIWGGMLLLVVPGCIQIARLFVALPVALVEGCSSGAAVRRSAELAKGNCWLLFSAWLSCFVLQAGAERLLRIASDGARGLLDSWPGIMGVVALDTLLATMQVVAYVELRKGKEDVARAAAAEVFQ